MARRRELCPARRPGRASGLVKQSYRLLFFAAFFVEAFFVLFLAVFLAAIKWLLHVRRPVVRPHARSGTPNSERAVICDWYRASQRATATMLQTALTALDA